ncbi:MAG: polysaccharide export protein [Acidobacteria bacterium]|nr:polysaccharide export protein [Acidobacteriota bacterium]
MKISHLIVLSFLLAVAFAVPAAAQDSLSEYRVGPKDLLEIRVLEIPELNVERRVADNGSIALPLIGELPVSGLTPQEIRNSLETLLREKYVNRANVSIIIREFANKPVSIVGAVARPGSLTVSGQWTLLQAISAAGGLTQQAGRKIYVLRRGENGLSDTLEINRDDLLQRTSAMWDIPIYPADVVNIPARTTVTIFALGEVRQPGALEFDSDDRITLLSVIAKAGGMTDRAARTVLIKRRGPDGKDVETEVNFRGIIAGNVQDPELRADDVVVVKESFF